MPRRGVVAARTLRDGGDVGGAHSRECWEKSKTMARLSQNCALCFPSRRRFLILERDTSEIGAPKNIDPHPVLSYTYAAHLCTHFPVNAIAGAALA